MNSSPSVAIDASTVVVAAQQEEGNSTGVDGNEANNGALESGALYVFR